MARLCFGEFDWPDERGKREFLQVVFLDAIAKIDQAPLKQLYDKPFELYRRCGTEFHLDFEAIYLPWRLTGARRSIVRMLNAEIEAWCKAWHLDAKWCREAALTTLHAWSGASRTITELYFQHPGGGGAIPTPPDPPGGFPEYRAYWMSRDYYLDMVKASALEAIKNHQLLHYGSRLKANAFAASIVDKARPYCRTVEAVYKECGWKRCRTNEKKNLKQHLEWTVRFQVTGKTFSELAEDANVKQTTVSRAVRDILSILRLEKRPDSRPGRIRGSKNRRQVESHIRRNLGRDR